MQRRSVPRTDPRYRHIRSKNNDSVKKSREKSRRERDETVESIQQLEEENRALTERIQELKQEYEKLQDLFKQHTGISIDSIPSSETNSKSTPAPTPISIQPKPAEEPIPCSNSPVLTIKTTEDNSTTAVSNTQLDPHNLDGAIVLINGVQYKIVSMMNKN